MKRKGIKMPINASQKPIYESFAMIHPNGELMCYTNFKRANWYIEKGLAEWIEERKFVLKFEPNGSGKNNLPYYTQILENKCVVCGTDDNEKGLNKHHVVPYVFRSRFPVQYKESNHHDVLVTCVDCHEDYEKYANQLKTKLANDLGISTNQQMSVEEKLNKKILSARNILLRMKEIPTIKIPEEKLQKLEEEAKKDLLPIEKGLKGAFWADKIIENVLEKDDLFNFVKMWRQHFIEFAKPQFLPNYWRVDHPLEVIDQEKKIRITIA